MKSYYLLFIILIFLSAGTFVFAQEGDLSGVTYPVAELGNCKNQDECAAYCDLPENMEVCLDFAEAHNLLPPLEIKMARDMLELEETAGPGGCEGHIECAAYCDDISHIEECVAFAEEHGLIPPEELEEAKKVMAAIRQGIQPPNCKSKSECDIYCQAPEHAEECITFAEAAGLMPPDELEEAKKFLAAIKKGVKPPACSGKEECDIYCAAEEHLEECLTFAEAAGFISPEDAAMARRTGGKGPGGCRGKEECDAFCEDPANAEECINFAEEFGFMFHEEAEQARKMLKAGLGLGGPGGCKGKEECEAYCNDISHMVECVDFAEKAGFMSPEDAARARRMAEMGVMGGPGGCKEEEECRAFCENPANMEVCLDFAVKVGDMTLEQAEQAKRGMEMMQQGGPGGCRSEEECRAYCEDPAHGVECINFSVQQGFMTPEEGQRMLEMMMQRQQQMPPEGVPPEGMPPEGIIPPTEGMPPGGVIPGAPCASPEECTQYCLQNPADPVCQAMGCICPMVYQPVCGTDGRTYGNMCQLQCMVSLGVSLSHEGPCEMGTKPPEGITPPPTEITAAPEIPSTEAPQSFLEQIRIFLADLLSALGF